MVMEEQETDMELASESIPVPQVQEPQLDPIKRPKKSNRSNRSNQPRKRKKLLYASIRTLMEFYFSDANLSKDRYLSALIKENPYVDIAEFMKFNKLNQLTTDPDRIARALRDSTMLRLSEDGTKVCRITPIKKKEDEDQCTVYVQNLPPIANHDWLISRFSKYGLVEYVSIPRYKYSYNGIRTIKGFAFVEFDKPSSAQECIKDFQKKGRVLPSHTSPTDLLSISTFDDNQKNTVAEASMETDDKNSKKSLKRRKSLLEKLSSYVDESGIKSKRKRKEVTEQTTANQCNEKESLLKIKPEDDNCENCITENSNIETENTSDKKQLDTNKKHFKKKKHSSKSISESDVKDNNTEHCNIETQGISEKKTNTVDNNSLRERKRKYFRENKEKSDIKDNIVDNTNTEDQDVSEKRTYIIDGSSLRERKRGHSPENTDESDVKDNIFDNTNTEDQDVTEEKTHIAGDSSLKERKRRHSPENTDESDIKDDITENCYTESQDVCKKNSDMTDSGKSSKKKKRSSKTIDENEFRDNITESSNIENCNIENQEVRSKNNRTKTGEKKKKRVSINNSIESSTGETVKRDSHGRHSKINSDMEERDVKTDLKKKKKKKKRKKNRNEENDICNLLGLQVMAKPDWKRLRNKYLDLQRSKMSLLKQHLRKTEMERGEIMTKKKWNNDKTEQDCDRFKDEQENETEVMDVEEPSYGRVIYAPGIIVKIEMDEPCTDPQKFKMELKDNNSIKYIDVTDGSREAYVRCDTADAAQSLVQKSYEGKHLAILRDDEEKSYWEKIAQDRKDKLSNKRRVKQRGRQKLLKKAEKQLGKCIKFDQD